MKVSLVVAQGVHQGKVIPIATSQFLIGRDAHCNLRPASASVSKQHCGIFVQDGKVVIKDYGSTNGTCINGEQVSGEREIANDDQLKIGPLEFIIRIDASTPASTVVAAPPGSAKKAASPPKAQAPAPAAPAPAADVDSEQAAALLMAMDDGGSPTEEAQVPDGTTVMDIPAMPGDPPAEVKPPPKPTAPQNSSKAAADILSKYMRRPRT